MNRVEESHVITLLMLMLTSFLLSFSNNYPEYLYLLFWNTHEPFAILPSISLVIRHVTQHAPTNNPHNNERPRISCNICYTIPYFEPCFLFICFRCIVRSRLDSRLSPHSGQNMSLDRVRHDMRTTDRHTPNNLYRTNEI